MGVNKNNLAKFEEFLKYLDGNETIEVETIKEIYETYTTNKKTLTSDQDVILRSGIASSLLRLADRIKA